MKWSVQSDIHDTSDMWESRDRRGSTQPCQSTDKPCHPSNVLRKLQASLEVLGTFLDLGKDIDFASSTVTISPLKHSEPTRLKMSSRTVNQLSQLRRDHAWIFGDGTLRTYQHFLRNFEMTRKEAARRLGNPRLNDISFRTLRHSKPVGAKIELKKRHSKHSDNSTINGECHVATTDPIFAGHKPTHKRLSSMVQIPTP